MLRLSSASTSLLGKLHSFPPFSEANVRRRLLLLDVYPTPLYISTERLEAYDAPVRYLRTSGTTPPVSSWYVMLMFLIVSHKDPSFMPFSPPNLIQATCAAFASIATLSAAQAEIILLFLPSRHMSIPQGNDISSSPHTSRDMNDSIWSVAMMRRVHTCLTKESATKDPAPWQGESVFLKQSEIKRRGDIGDGGMYI